MWEGGVGGPQPRSQVLAPRPTQEARGWQEVESWTGREAPTHMNHFEEVDWLVPAHPVAIIGYLARVESHIVHEPYDKGWLAALTAVIHAQFAVWDEATA